MPAPELTPYLDTSAAAARVDKDDLARILAEFPLQLSKASREFNELALPQRLAQVKALVFCGMGGSAIGAEVACTLPPNLKRKPLELVRDYDLPGWVSKDTAVIVISYSGETAEALACFDQALARAGIVIAVTSGGELAKRATAAGVPLYKFDYQAPPRDALGYLFAPAVAILAQARVLQTEEADLSAAIKLLQELSAIYLPQVPTPQNPAKQLAYTLFDHVPIVIGSNITRAVARRWKNQFNEHGKTASWFDELPEANHNTVEGFAFPARFKDDAVVIFLESNFDHPKVVKRQLLWREHLKRQGVQTEAVAASGADLWSNKLSLIYLGDWASYYLALLHRIDPAAIPTIKELKSKLSAG